MVAPMLSVGESWAEMGLGIVGFFTAVFVILSPWSTFKNIYKTKEVGTTKPYSYLSVVLNSAIWVIFGIPAIVKLTHGNVHHHAIVDWLSFPLMLANIAGVIIEFGYVAIFIRASAGHRRWPVVGLFAVVLVSFVVLVLYLATGWSRTFVGYIAMFSGVAMYFIPVISTYTAYKSNDFTQIPPYQASASLLNGAVWTAYSCIRRVHAFIFVPNVVAIICAGGQLIVRCVLKYRAPPQDLEAARGRQSVAEDVVDKSGVGGDGGELVDEQVLAAATPGAGGGGALGAGAGGSGHLEMSEVQQKTQQDVPADAQQSPPVEALQGAQGVQGTGADEILDGESEVKDDVLVPGGGNKEDELEKEDQEQEGGGGHSKNNGDGDGGGTAAEEPGENKSEGGDKEIPA